MFDFDCVIDEGTYDDFKECVFAVVYLPPIEMYTLTISSTPVHGQVRRLNARWVQETDHAMQAAYNLRAEAVLVQALRQALNGNLPQA